MKPLLNSTPTCAKALSGKDIGRNEPPDIAAASVANAVYSAKRELFSLTAGVGNQ